MKASLNTFLFIILTYSGVFSQGHIDHIKNQKYLADKDNVDCSQAEDNRSIRICANLTYQKSDSLLTTVYNDILDIATDHHIDNLTEKVTEMQATWRAFRDQHCGIVYNGFEGCGSCHIRSITYLLCLTELTDNRRKELETLREYLE